ncbi:unnamed protein product [Schistosoma mattheei]|uniref:Uncharacterized protein n=1 Tax=Schistosoma mattheei TaxID=31246 RepID=A0A183PZD3_9TREM|nr:unnamed protein product [Schistosoma mattheei]
MLNYPFQDARTTCINYEAVNELDIQSMKISNTLLNSHDELQSKGQSNLSSFNSDSYSRVNMKGVSTKNYKPNHKGYSQTQREALAVFWAVKRLHKYLFGKKFTVVTDYEALKFIYHPEKSLARSSAAMVQRWSIALSEYDYTVQHRSAKQIQHVDYTPRQLLQDRPVYTSDCLLVQPLPEPGESVPISVVNPNANDHILDNTESLSDTMSDRLRMNLRKRRTIDYKHLDSNLSCGGCGV